MALLLGLLDGQPPSPSTSTVIAIADAARARRIARLPQISADWVSGAVAAVALYHRDQLLELLRALSTRGDREALAERASRALVRDEAKLKIILSHDGVPLPTRLAPSDAEIRAALGLR